MADVHDKPEPLIHPATLTASAIAAAAATAAASYFGMAGTIIGAVLASVVATVVSATSAHSLQRTPKFAFTAVGVLAVVMLSVTGVEGLVGKPLSSLMGSGEGTGTTIGRAVGGDGQTTRTIVKKIVVEKTPTAPVTEVDESTDVEGQDASTPSSDETSPAPDQGAETPGVDPGTEPGPADDTGTEDGSGRGTPTADPTGGTAPTP